MAYPQKLLGDDEKIVFEMRPAWKVLIPATIWFFVIIAAGAFLLGRISSWFSGSSADIARAVVIIAALGFLIALSIRPFIFWWTTQYVFTNRRIIIRTGVIARQGRDMPLSKVNDVSFSHTVMERIFNVGTLVVQSAAENSGLVIANVPNVETVQREVYRLHDEDDAFRRNRYDHNDPTPPTIES